MTKKEKIKKALREGEYDKQIDIAKAFDTTESYVSEIRREMRDDGEVREEEIITENETKEPEPEPEEEKETEEEETEELETGDDEAETYNCGGCGAEIEYLQKRCDSCGEALMWSAV